MQNAGQGRNALSHKSLCLKLDEEIFIDIELSFAKLTRAFSDDG